MVRVRGFEPLPSAFQVRSSAGLSYTLFELDPTTGFEPASSASVARCSSSELRGEIGAPRSMKMGTIHSPWHYDVGAYITTQQLKMRGPTLSLYA